MSDLKIMKLLSLKCDKLQNRIDHLERSLDIATQNTNNAFNKIDKLQAGVNNDYWSDKPRLQREVG